MKIENEKTTTVSVIFDEGSFTTVIDKLADRLNVIMRRLVTENSVIAVNKASIEIMVDGNAVIDDLT